MMNLTEILVNHSKVGTNARVGEIYSTAGELGAHAEEKGPAVQPALSLAISATFQQTSSSAGLMGHPARYRMAIWPRAALSRKPETRRTRIGWWGFVGAAADGNQHCVEMGTVAQG